GQQRESEEQAGVHGLFSLNRFLLYKNNLNRSPIWMVPQIGRGSPLSSLFLILYSLFVLERLPEILPGLLVVHVHQEGPLRRRGRQDRQERDRLLRRVVDAVHDLLRDEGRLVRLQDLLLRPHPLLAQAVEDVDDLLARRVVVELVA